MLISKVMTSKVISASPEQSLRRAAQIMERNDFDCMPICLNKRFIGTITIRDIVSKVVEFGLALDEFTIEDLMTPDSKFLFEDQTIYYALSLMNENQLCSLMVVNRDNELAGIITLEDIMLSIKGTNPELTNKDSNIEVDLKKVLKVSRKIKNLETSLEFRQIKSRAKNVHSTPY
ncbi:CBS domain-containing protein [Methylophilus luteus]|uniref:CBS domain-containing protein n=1 Tax=Methylophilus luteus TaxID=640108 RepID=A0ABW3FA90_9PROT